jgi:hypothetical protein
MSGSNFGAKVAQCSVQINMYILWTKTARLLPGAYSRTVTLRQRIAIYTGASLTRFRMERCPGECRTKAPHWVASYGSFSLTLAGPLSKALTQPVFRGLGAGLSSCRQAGAVVCQ